MRRRPTSNGDQLVIPWPSAGPWDAFLAVRPVSFPAVVVPADVELDQAVGRLCASPGICLGTSECLCGQFELSDDPLWIENE